mmetsp:Transcript_4193/g.6288  ORF Transcript_4193/g.6288 Transcript_4193/m.6288 type:complete len:459 (+) Transcript_4193:76-1452(+)
MVKTVGKYDLYGTLGEGAFGKVKYAVNTETNEAVAIKILDKDKIQARNMGAQIKKEISIMKMINHHYVVGVKDVFATSAKIFIVLEFVGGGELFDKIANEGKLSEDKARFYFRQLVEGLEHCHNNGVCHRDLKPENLLLDTEGNLKISDFGFSTLNIGDADGDGDARAELLHTTCGTPNYVAPEVLGKDGYDGKKADVWSIGVILYVLLAGYLPFDENTMAGLFQKIKAADFEYPAWFSDEARNLISKVLVPDPQQRARISDLKQHSWFTKGGTEPPLHSTHPNTNNSNNMLKSLNNPNNTQNNNQNNNNNNTSENSSSVKSKSNSEKDNSASRVESSVNPSPNQPPPPPSATPLSVSETATVSFSSEPQVENTTRAESTSNNPNPSPVESMGVAVPATPAVLDVVAVSEGDVPAEVTPAPATKVLKLEEVRPSGPPVVGGGGGFFSCFGCGGGSLKD